MRSPPVPGRVGGGTLRRWAGVIVTAMLALSAGRASAVAPARMWPHPEQLAPNSPAVSTSVYETNADPGRVWRQGCGAGRAAKSGIVILDWGRPAFRHGYGTIDFGGHFDQNAAIGRDAASQAALVQVRGDGDHRFVTGQTPFVDLVIQGCAA